MMNEKYKDELSEIKNQLHEVFQSFYEADLSMGFLEMGKLMQFVETLLEDEEGVLTEENEGEE